MPEMNLDEACDKGVAVVQVTADKGPD